MVVRPRSGLNVFERSEGQLHDCIARATGIEPEQAADDILRASPKQNTFVISTPSIIRAEAHARIRELPVGGATYEVMAYAAPPDNTSRVVIRNIPDYGTPKDITRSLVYKKNQTVLQARRLGESSSVMILFKGRKSGTKPTCAQNPKPLTARSAACNSRPKTTHASRGAHFAVRGTPRAAISVTKRFQTSYLLRRRQPTALKLQGKTIAQQKARTRKKPIDDKEEEIRVLPPSTRQWKPQVEGREPRRPATLETITYAHRDQSQASTPIGDRDTGRPPREDQANDYRSDGGLADPTKERVSWARTISRKANIRHIGILDSNPQQNEQSELARIRQLLELVMQENRELKMELATLKGGKETAPAAPEITSANAQASKPREEQTPRNEAPARGHNHSFGEDSDPPRKRTKEESGPITLAETVARKLEIFGNAIRAEMKAAIAEAIGAMQEVLRRPLGETAASRMSSRMSQMEAALMEKKSKHCKPHDRHSSKDALRTFDYNFHAKEGLTFITDPNESTRQGNSVTKDTTPDLAFVRNLAPGSSVEWSNLGKDLCSDHVITAIQITAGQSKPRGVSCKISNWEKFRQCPRYRVVKSAIRDIEEWTTKITKMTEEATTTAKESVQKRPKRNKPDRPLKRRIAKLYLEIQEYADKHALQNWHALCERTELQMSTAKAWNILRPLMDPTQSSTEQLMQVSGETPPYAQSGRRKGDHPRDAGQIHARTPLSTPNAKLDQPFTMKELTAALHDLRPKSVPGTDNFANKMLRNLADQECELLLDYFKKCWDTATLPKQWKRVLVRLIPKLGKTLSVENLRPISLISCLGKPLEHMVLTRINDHMEDNQLYPRSMVGFRAGLWTQDVMLQLQHQIFSTEDKASTDGRVIDALDLTKAFYRPKHEAILRSLQSLAIGKKTYDYVRKCLTARTAQPKVGPYESPEATTGSTGTPQGSVTSPFPFNATMIKLGNKLQSINEVRHSIYSDYVTLWTAGDRDGDIQDRLQEAIGAVETHVKTLGLSGRKLKDSPQTQSIITLRVRETAVPQMAEIRVLGLHLQGNGHNSKTVEKQKISSLIKRALKQALEIPICGPNEKSEALSVHNTLEELIEAQRTAHLERLTKTATGRHLLDSLRIAYEKTFGDKLSIPAELRKSIHSGKVLAACSIQTKHPEKGEELAIALALATTHERKIVSDSQPAIRNFARGTISGAALRNHLIWTPTHAALEDNERANEAVRDLTHREPLQPGPHFTNNSKDRLCTYREVLDHYKRERRTYPPANPSLTKKQEVAHFHPEIHDGRCKHSHELAGLTHMLWECPSIERQDSSNSNDTFIIISKEIVLLSETPDIQQWAVKRSEDAAKSQDILVVV
ncbi:hypothetical protein HPB47_015327 [Ixodes persulcatus]|uniref:Uncharacterized protein n=1 Tax=Ixodes persulcatus TaxID=34615 RepID=A0AC60QXC0_IXOPE|nr:hypothetical protein HPB47_015327 [Ixodes persulcatus]